MFGNSIWGRALGSVGDFITGGPSKMVSNTTDWLGITDSGAGQRGYEAMKSGADAAYNQLKSDMQPVFDMYGNAMQGRDMGGLLDTYTENMMGTENAAGAENVQNFMNPMYQRALTGTANQALGGAGSSANSSAANNAVANAVANQSTSMWQQAFQNALADAKNRQGVYGSTTEANLMPAMNWAQLTSDVAGTAYTKGMDLAQAGGQVAGQNQSWLGNIF